VIASIIIADLGRRAVMNDGSAMVIENFIHSAVLSA